MRIIRYLLIIALSMTFASFAYASMDDKSDRVSNNQSSIFSPGYINAVKQHAENVANQANRKPTFWENAMEYVKNKLSGKIEQNAAERTAVKLQKKTSSSGDGKTAAKKEEPAVYETAPQGSVTITAGTKIDIGSGTLKHYESGRMISEYINGVKYIYVGFDNVGFISNGGTNPIQSAINQATANDVIIVRGGAGKVYSGDLTISNSVHLYGGFDESGQRNSAANPTSVVGNATLSGAPVVEMNRLSVSGGNTTVNSGSNLYAINSQFNCTILVYGGAYGGGGVSWGNLVLMGVFGSGPSSFNISTLGAQPRQVLVEKAPSASAPAVALNYNYDDVLRNQRSSEDKYAAAFYQNINTGGTNVVGNTLVSAMRAFLGGKDPYVISKTGELGGLSVNGDTLAGNALAVPMVTAENMDGTAGNMKLVLLLANILKNPTIEQKLILDAVTDILKDFNEDKEGRERSPELKKAQDDLLQVVANILIAQAMPDLLKEGDVTSIKNVFQDMNTQKSRMITEYNTAIEPYYKEVKKLLAKNLAILQLNNIVSKTMVENELNKMEPSEIDRIVDKIKKMRSANFETNYILQEEGKLRSKYVDPNKKAFEDNMKAMLEGFTARLSKILEGKRK
jgi:hypothetical protein